MNKHVLHANLNAKVDSAKKVLAVNAKAALRVVKVALKRRAALAVSAKEALKRRVAITTKDKFLVEQ